MTQYEKKCREYNVMGIITPKDFLESRTGVTLSEDIIKEILVTLRHARTFITSREKMHPDGVMLYDELIKNLEDIL